MNRIEERFTKNFQEYHQSNHSSIVYFLMNNLDEEKNLQFLVSEYRSNCDVPENKSDSREAVYSRFYRLIQSLGSEEYVDLNKRGNDLVWVAPQAKFFNLISQVQNSKYRKEKAKKEYPYPQRAKYQRIQAIKRMDSRKYLTDSDKDFLMNKFEDYKQEINNSTIILEREEEAPYNDKEYLFMDYKTRFNDEGRKGRYLKKYDESVDKSLEDYKFAIHLTLTTDPKKFDSMWKANRHFSKAFNRFMSFLDSRLGERPTYIAVYEFTKKGYLHAHVIFFGKKWLLNQKTISREWEKCGQGKIVYIYGMENKRGKWRYKNEEPDDYEENEGAGNYLKKYLRKSAYVDYAQLFYWITNKRFFTRSKVLLVDDDMEFVSAFSWNYLGTFTDSNIPGFVLKAQSRICWGDLDPPPPLEETHEMVMGKWVKKD